jgi:hypothetical protein
MEGHSPFYISLQVNDLLLHNCMLDSRASTIVMPLYVMKQLGLTTTRPYGNLCAMDVREVKVFGLIKYLHVKLDVYLDISNLMDVVVINIPYSWGMFLFRKWDASLGGSLKMDLSYAIIPTCEGTFVPLHREQFRIFHVEDPKEPMN